MIEKDRHLVQRAVNGDIESFNHLIKKYQGAVYGLAYHWTRHFADAEDIAQEALIQAFENLSQLRDPDRFPGWLRMIALNTCRKRLRGTPDPMVSLDAPGHRDIRDQLKDPGQLPDQDLEVQQKQRAVRQILDALSEPVRLTVTLYYIDDLSHKEISQFLGIPISTIKSRLHRARNILKEEALKMVEETFDAQQKPEVVIRKVSGYLHIPEGGDGWLRKTPGASASPDDIAVWRKDILDFDMKQGDFIEAHLYGPASTFSEGSRMVRNLFQFHRINENAVILRCSFCSKREDQVEGFVTGPRVQICAACIEACVEVLEKEKNFRISLTQEPSANISPKAKETQRS